MTLRAPFNFTQHLPAGEVPVQLGVAIWLDPSDSANYTLTSSKYEQIVNKGSFGGSVDQATSTKRLTQLANHFGTGLHAAQGDGSDDIMDVTGTWDLFLSDTEFSFYWVVDYTTGGNDGVVDFTAGDLLIHQNEYLRMWNGSTGIRLSEGTYAGGTAGIIECHRTSSGTFTAYFNGVDDTHNAGPSDNTDIGQMIYAFGTIAWESNKKQGDILLFPTNLDGNGDGTGDAATVRTFLNDKWSIY